ncbi:MAG: MBL fold metallo-hydrolase, partial [Clostridia bacterium]|nr:MBL fold metallo-hydrolase [Clostridia bacterium]
MYIAENIKYVGVNDHIVDLFEGQYFVPNGISYNSYVILDKKVAVLDTVDSKFTHEWLDNVKNAVGGKNVDYLVVHHMEPDHSANIKNFLNVYKNAKVVSSSKAFTMMQQYFGEEFIDRRVVVKEGDKLNLGEMELTFYSAPMVHWPEVMVSYESQNKILFSADGFGKFGALDVEDEWACEARRYYFGIVGKYGLQVQNILKKASSLDIEIICPLHGPVLNENLGYYLNLYDVWSSY